MPWEYLLSGVSGAGVAIVFTLLFIKKVVEKSVDSQFDLNLEKFKSEQNKVLETRKSELDIWAFLRKDILKEVWEAHRAIVASMGNVIKTVQEPFALVSLNEMETTLRNMDGRNEIATHLKESLMQFRDINHNTIDLVSDEAGDICQNFFNEAFELSVMLSSPPNSDETEGTRIKEVIKDLATDLKSDKTKVDKVIEDHVTKLNSLLSKSETPVFLPKIVALKEQRKAFYHYVAEYFGLEEIMPWLVRNDKKV